MTHIGGEVFEAEEVSVATDRLRGAGFETLVEDETTCCYAKADKVWATEPDGLRWEWYRVIEDSKTFGEEPECESAETPNVGSCC